MNAKTKRAEPEPIYSGRGPTRPPQQPSAIENAWTAWREADFAESAALSALLAAEMHGAMSMSAINARRVAAAASNLTRRTKTHLTQLAHQATGALPHDLPEETHR